MNIKSFLTIRVLAIAILLLFLGLACMTVWKIHSYDLEGIGDSDKYSMFINQYKISRSAQWSKAFDQLPQQNYSQVSFIEKGNSLFIDEKYVA
jgi:hypothetical protein